MAKNRAVQYEVVAVDIEDRVHWQRWRRRQRSTVLKFDDRKSAQEWADARRDFQRAKQDGR